MAQVKLSKIEIVQALLALEAEDFAMVMCTVAKANPHPDKTAYITNKFQQYRKKGKADASKTKDESTGELELFQRPMTPQMKEGRDGKSSRASGRSPFASLLPDIPAAAAWQVPLIFRGDAIPANGKLFLDIEKLSMKLSWNYSGPVRSTTKHKQVGNNIAVVDENGLLVLWAFIYRNPDQICQYITNIHRVSKANILGGVQIETVRNILEKCFKNNIVIGAKLGDDLKAMSLDSEFMNGIRYGHDKTIDLQDFYVDGDRRPINLKDLVAHFFPDKANDFQSGQHSAISDARMTLQLYLKMCEMKKQDKGLVNTSEMNITRTKKKFKYDPRDICKCKRT